MRLSATHHAPTLPAIERKCEKCGRIFRSKNTQAAHMMLAGKLRLCDTCRRAAAGRPVNYAEYLKSDAWQTRRAAALRRAEHRCQVCGAAERLEVHHRSYERLGNERPADLVVLCRKCHQVFHDNRTLVRSRPSCS